MIICLSKHNKHGKVSVIGYVLFVHLYFNSTTMKKDIGIPGLMAVVAVLYLLGQIASCHETTKSTEATITTDGHVTSTTPDAQLAEYAGKILAYQVLAVEHFEKHYPSIVESVKYEKAHGRNREQVAEEMNEIPWLKDIILLVYDKY